MLRLSGPGPALKRTSRSKVSTSALPVSGKVALNGGTRALPGKRSVVGIRSLGLHPQSGDLDVHPQRAARAERRLPQELHRRREAHDHLRGVALAVVNFQVVEQLRVRGGRGECGGCEKCRAQQGPNEAGGAVAQRKCTFPYVRHCFHVI